jgi:RHH-type proline utilization regulon transcriptional repressor/proline dehydrogenase/delta 1-pyrroline-5-carboxylate dehydrogenase
MGLSALAGVSLLLPDLFIPQLKQQLRRDTARVILPGEPERLRQHLQARRRDGVQTNVNHLGEAILGEGEAQRRLSKYLEALAREEVDYISVKLSTIGSQLSVLDFNGTIERVAPRLRTLYDAAMAHSPSKFINLDMEEYQDLELTLELFMRVLSESKFHSLSAGIVLQAYLPDAHSAYERLLTWAKERYANGGAPIKIRVVKGANLAMERFHSALHHWPQAPYPSKGQVDSSFKRLLEVAMQPSHAVAVNVGVASHNLFDVAWALLLRSERELDESVSFEMLEGMADPIRRVVQAVSGDMLLYCPAAAEHDFASAIAYLVRRLDENTAPQNFLRHAFGLAPGTPVFKQQASQFKLACTAAPEVSTRSRRAQNRALVSQSPPLSTPFVGEASTDWTNSENRLWIQRHLKTRQETLVEPVTLAIGGVGHVTTSSLGTAYDPSTPAAGSYRYHLADWEQIDFALDTAVAAQAEWSQRSVEERARLLVKAADVLRRQRGPILATMVLDGGKTIEEADPELCEAIDFLEYYARSASAWAQEPGVSFSPLGTVLVTPPWNFPLAIPLGGVAAALVMGNTVLLKPAPEVSLLGRCVAELFWEAGIDQHVLQFIMCPDTPVGSRLVADERVDAVILTGATATAEHFLALRPDLHLMAETGGKNAIIVSRLSDRDLAISDIVQSAFGHAGQKCSAASLLICEAEVYDDPDFRRQLVDAARSVIVGSAWSPATRIGPLISSPEEPLLSGLSVLDEGEEWLLKPSMIGGQNNLWSPGIKCGVKAGSRSHQTEFFGPVLSMMRADDLRHAVALANGTKYGLTSGLHSLDPREIEYWLEHIEAGNLYVNRGITGAIVERQPFGGCKASGFGRGAKAGGLNYLSQLVRFRDANVSELIGETPTLRIQKALEDLPDAVISSSERRWLFSAISNDQYVWQSHFSQSHDPARLAGQDNLFEYRRRAAILLRVYASDSAAAVARVVLLSLAIDIPVHVVLEPEHHIELVQWINAWGHSAQSLTDEQLKGAIRGGRTPRYVRCFRSPSHTLGRAVIGTPVRLTFGPCTSAGRVEALYFLREQSTSIDYHRYGNLGLREAEERSGAVPLPGDPELFVA